MKSKRKKNEKGFTLIELIMVIVILGIISAVAIPKYLSLSDAAKLSAARGVGSAVSASIQSEHSDYLINGLTYSMADVLSGTAFTSGITYNASAGAPLAGEIRINGMGNGIALNLIGDVFEWDWTAPSGDTTALINEDSSSTFP